MAKSPRYSSLISTNQAAIGQEIVSATAVAGPQLTDGIDNIVGTGADEIFTAPPSSINASDTLEGGAGIDTL